MTWPTQALMEVGMCAAILTETFVLKLPLPLSVHLPQFAFLSVRIPHRSSNHRIWLVCSLMTSSSRV
jgi:hypothetical protein